MHLSPIVTVANVQCNARSMQTWEARIVGTCMASINIEAASSDTVSRPSSQAPSNILVCNVLKSGKSSSWEQSNSVSKS